MNRDAFSVQVARVLKANFPELGTQREMEGADTVDALNSLYELAKRGAPLRGAPAGICPNCGRGYDTADVPNECECGEKLHGGAR